MSVCVCVCVYVCVWCVCVCAWCVSVHAWVHTCECPTYIFTLEIHCIHYDCVKGALFQGLVVDKFIKMDFDFFVNTMHHIKVLIAFNLFFSIEIYLK